MSIGASMFAFIFAGCTLAVSLKGFCNDVVECKKCVVKFYNSVYDYISCNSELETESENNADILNVEDNK